MIDLITGKMVKFIRIAMILIAAVIYCVSTALVVPADDVVPKPTETIQPLLPEAMRENCRETNNGCQVCVMLPPSGIVHCSLPGIACQPRAWSCRVPIDKQVDGVTSEK